MLHSHIILTNFSSFKIETLAGFKTFLMQLIHPSELLLHIDKLALTINESKCAGSGSINWIFNTETLEMHKHGLEKNKFHDSQD